MTADNFILECFMPSLAEIGLNQDENILKNGIFTISQLSPLEMRGDLSLKELESHYLKMSNWDEIVLVVFEMKC